MQNGYGYVPNTGQYNAGNTFGQFGTNPQAVQQHIAQDLHQGGYGYAPYSNQGYPNQGHPSQQTYHSSHSSHQVGDFSQYGTNPQMVHQHNAQDSGYTQNDYTPHGQQGYGYGASMLSQFGTNPQAVQQHIHTDLAYGQGAITSRQAGSYRPNYQNHQIGAASYASHSYPQPVSYAQPWHGGHASSVPMNSGYPVREQMMAMGQYPNYR